MSRFRGLESKCFELHKHKLITDASFLRLTCKGRVKVIQMIQGKTFSVDSHHEGEMGIRQWPPRPGRPRLKSSSTATDSFNSIRKATGLVQMAVAIQQHVHLRLAMRENSPLRTAP